MFLCKKTTKYVEQVQRKTAETAFPAYFRHFRPEKNFSQKSDSAILWAYASLCKKSEKTNDEISRKCQNTGFSGIFPVFSAGKKFFPEIGLRHILGIAILHLCAKNQQKRMSQSREKLVTDGRTDGRTDNG